MVRFWCQYISHLVGVGGCLYTCTLYELVKLEGPFIAPGADDSLSVLGTESNTPLETCYI